MYCIYGSSEPLRHFEFSNVSPLVEPTRREKAYYQRCMDISTAVPVARNLFDDAVRTSELIFNKKPAGLTQLAEHARTAL